MDGSAFPFPVVGIGASAGGIEALDGFFRGLPANPGFAVVIVTHLSPERDSFLHEIIRRFTTMPVTTISNELELEPDCIFVLPSNAVLTVEKGRLMVRKNAGHRERKSIDIFFSSLAIDVGEMAVGIVLSGGDGDGTLGIKAIKERGGLTFAQVRDGFGPGHPDMPASAIATGLVDFAIPVEQMGHKLIELTQGNKLLDGLIEESDDEQGIHRVMPEIYAILRNQIRHDFSGYKTRTFVRRVLRRMNVSRAQVFATDIDERALAVARAARYPEAMLDNVSPERRKRFFVLDGASYLLSKDVRELCIFSPHSVAALDALSSRLGALGRVQGSRQQFAKR
ncbi:chemotaxis protein CheB [Bradyrhizobium sp.]|uniref:chemotaxis protein CheB n=1 Tax=Bradyrhizobium sp. TaxID=376 RepID=UPI003C539E93